MQSGFNQDKQSISGKGEFMKKEDAIKVMRSIAEDFLNYRITRGQAVEQLIHRIDIDYIHSIDSKSEPENFFITDLYWTIKHLTEIGYETSDEEIRYFNDCLDGKRRYNTEEKNMIIRGHL
jgi:hypothetical protein